MKARSLQPDDVHPIARLDTDDLDMIAAFVLESGSIKALARRYEVSYPTMRSRLDALIERLRMALAGPDTQPLTEYLATLIEQGRIAPNVARTIRDLHAEALKIRRPGPDAESGVLSFKKPDRATGSSSGHPA